MVGGQYSEPIMARTGVFSAWRRVFASPSALAGRPGRMPGQGWPSTCLVCRAWPRASVCEDCLNRFAAPVSRCARCATTLMGMGTLCGACALDAPPMRGTWAAVDYAYPWDGLINALKHHDALDVLPALAGLMLNQRHRSRSADEAEKSLSGAVLLPIPMTPRRLRARGHNPAWELARRLAPALGLRADAHLLIRVREGAPQQGQGRAARLANLSGAFGVAPGGEALLRGRDLILVDDVMTTGATLREAACTLLDAGAGSVQAWVLARTPLPSPRMRA